MAGGVFLQIFFLAMLIMPPVKTQSSSENTPAKHAEKEYEQVSSMRELTMKLFTNRSFLLLLFSHVIHVTGINALYTFILALLESEGLSANMSNMVLSSMGFSSLLGNLGLSGLSQLSGFRSMQILVISGVICGE